MTLSAVDLLQERWAAGAAMRQAATLQRSLYDCLRKAVLDGGLPPSTRLPASRDLAQALNLSRNTVKAAFEQLVAEGYLRAATGSGTYVCDVLPEEVLWASSEKSAGRPEQDWPTPEIKLSKRGSQVLERTWTLGSQWALNSPAGSRHKWVAGAALVKNDTSVREAIQVNFSSFGGATLSNETPAETLAGSAPYLEPVRQDAIDLGLFGQVDWALTDKLTLTTGLRGSWYRKKFVASLEFPGFSFGETPTEVSQSNLSFRAGLNYKVDPDNMVYASISQGVKSGGFSVQFILNPNQLPGAKQERLIAYEVGYKGKLARGLNLNLASFYYDYHDLQSLTQVFVNGVFTQRFSNIGNARVFGAEGDITWMPVRGLTLRGGATYLDTRITRSGDINGDGTANDFTGNKLQSAPEWSANYLARYDIPLSGDLDLSLQYDGSYTGNNWRSIDNNPFNYTEGSLLHNATIGLTGPNAGWALSAWIKNISDTRTMAWQFNFGGNMRRSYIPPRTFGATVEFKFR
ncbi:TonB-dependent receptor [Novosphingobium cyanobacteriorum]|uniref:TonB-dependent receptor n=1 Tax=Novosphingobium cyanobacteriorum TaxID=3024215 RepID=A0ABT6CHS4_9SPHN|nr:TonB-dependent receptor [Novosphingobium cyanobacteriorum]MDF8333479.1 TonB-dependent receptor [Novosphingobium cyanobacteriorum]